MPQGPPTRKIPDSTDCNDQSQLPQIRIERAEARLQKVVSRRCAKARQPSLNGYTYCRVPCGHIGVNNSGYDTVVNCLKCIAEDEVEEISQSVLATPPLFGSTSSVTKCHATVSRAVEVFQVIGSTNSGNVRRNRISEDCPVRSIASWTISAVYWHATNRDCLRGREMRF